MAEPYGESVDVNPQPIGPTPDLFTLPYGGPSVAQFVDTSDQTGERQCEDGTIINLLFLHEQLVRACFSLQASDDPVLTPLLHEKCTVHVREHSFASSGRELRAPAYDRTNAIALLRSEGLDPAVRMEPAELLPNGETRVHWCDADGSRYAQSAVWASDGLALNLVLVVEPPPTHREYLHALQVRSPYTAALLAPDVVLHDAAGESNGEAIGSEVQGAPKVLPRLLRWAADATAHSSTDLQVSRVSHLQSEQSGGRRTRLHAAGQWPTSITSDGAPTICLLEETIEWKYTPPSPTARVRMLREGRTVSFDRAKKRGGRGGGAPMRPIEGEAAGWQVWRIYRRTLALTEAVTEGSPPLPMNVYQAAALAGSTAVLCGPVGIDDDDGDLSASKQPDQDEEDVSSESEDEADALLRAPPPPPPPPTRPPLADGGNNLHQLLLPPALPGMAIAPTLNTGPRKPAARPWSSKQKAAVVDQAATAARAVAAATAMLETGGMTARQMKKRELEMRVGQEVRRALVAQRWALVSLRVRVRGKVALARLERLREAAAAEDEAEAAGDGMPGDGAGGAPAPAGEEAGDEEPDAEAEEAARQAALAYAGLKELPNGDVLDTFEMAVEVLDLQVKADDPSVTTLAGQLADGCTFTHTSGHHSGAPSAPPAPPGIAATHDGKEAVLEHLKTGGQLKRFKDNVKLMQPAALMADGRTRLNFAITVDGGEGTERLQDVLEWDEEGKIKSWIRVYEPRRSQRDWLQLVSRNSTGAFLDLLSQNCAFACLEPGAEPKVNFGNANVLEALKLLTSLMGGRIMHIGRTRELTEWTFPRQLGPPPPSNKNNPTTVVQAIFIGTWRQLGAKWYGEEVQCMRETAEWSGRQMTRLMWEAIPTDHPQAIPVFQRMKDKKKRAAAASRKRIADAEKVRANGSRPAWSSAQPTIPPSMKGLGLKAAEALGKKEIEALDPSPFERRMARLKEKAKA